MARDFDRTANRALMVAWIEHRYAGEPMVAVAFAPALLSYLAIYGKQTTGEVVMKDLRVLKRQGRILHAGFSEPDRYVMYSPLWAQERAVGVGGA